MDSPAGDGDLSSLHLDPQTAATVLDALQQSTDRAIAVVQPKLVDGRLVDGTVLWLTDKAKYYDPRVREGMQLTEVFGDALAHLDTGRLGQVAVDQPGQSITYGPFPVPFKDGIIHMEMDVRLIGGVLFVEYTDRTPEVLTRQAVERSEHNFHDLLEGLDAGVVLLRPTIGPEGRIIDAEIFWSNNASRALWKRPEGLAPGTRVTAMYYDQAEWLEAANEAWQGQPVSRMLRSDPDVTNWSSASETLRRVGDTIVELTIDRSRDLELLDRLTELDLRFRTIVADLPLTVLVAGPHGDWFDFVSPNAADLTRRSIGELQTLSQWQAIIHPDSAAEVETLLRESERLGAYETVVRLLRGDGEVATVWVRTMRRMMPDGPSGFIGLLNDITEQERLMQRIASGERLETLGRTAGSIAHDFNNLLMIVAGNIERASKQLGSDNMALSTALVATQRAAELASNLLGFAKGRPGEPRWVDPQRVLHAFEPILRGVLFPRAELRVEVERDLPEVWADAAHIEQILLNLVTNARDAIDDGGSVTVSMRRVDGARCHLLDSPGTGPYVAIAVADTGKGVPPALVNKIWEPFFSGKQATEDSGTGLGLSTVHGLAHQHGGHVDLVSRAGEGTTVTVYLPLSPNQR